MRVCSVLSVVSLAAILVACNDKDLLDPDGGGGTQVPLEVNVDATTSLTFNPNPVTLRAGGTVTYRFQSTAHTVIFEQVANRPDDIIQPTASQNVDRVFPAVGTFVYDCNIHDGMTGTVIVVAGTP
jgi:plastocyanin